tara:strand:+ start:2332 stop:3345 length:1014 start_codon:yes stop_codon:yes gene_type:complete
MVKTISNEELRKGPGLSYSTLKAFNEDPMVLINGKPKISHKGISIGGALDTLIFDGIEVLKEKYAVLSQKRPSAMLGDLADALVESNNYNTSKGGSVKINTLDGVEKANEMNLWKSLSKKSRDEDISKKLNQAFWTYVIEQSNIGDKEVLSTEDYMKIIELKQVLCNHNKIGKFFSKTVNKERYEVLFQPAFTFTVNEVEMKGGLDMVVIDHEEKRISPFDLKSTGDKGRNFPSSVFKYRYDLQGSAYMNCMIQWKDEVYPNYTVDSFKFVVISRTEESPKVWIYAIKPQDWLEKVNKNRTVKLEGLKEILDKYKWTLESKEFYYSKEHSERGYVTL